MEKVDILNLLNLFSKNNKNPYLYGYKNFYPSEIDVSGDFKGFHSESWAVGGMCGGSCWNNGAEEPISPEEPKEIELLDKFLEENMPQITFLQYKKLVNLINKQKFSVSEYYGNYTNYEFSYITFEDIAECLSKF